MGFQVSQCGECVRNCPNMAWTRSDKKYYRLTLLFPPLTIESLNHFEVIRMSSQGKREKLTAYLLAGIRGKRKKYDAQGKEMKFGRME